MTSDTRRLDADAAAAGLLLVGHGTRDTAGAREFLATCELVENERRWGAVEPCFLELAEPTIRQGFVQLVERGAPAIVVMPLLLFAAGHAKQDVPRAVAAVAAEYPALAVRYAEHLGCHPALLQLSAERHSECLADARDCPPADTLLLLVGRGSLDDEATAEMRHFAALRATLTPVGRVEVCFAAMARPSLAEGLATAAAVGFRRVVVQPHLLFSGLLLTGVQEQVAQFAAQHPDIELVVASHLGPHRLLVSAILDRTGGEA